LSDFLILFSLSGLWSLPTRSESRLVIGGEISVLARLTPRVSFCPVQRIKIANKAKVVALGFMEDRAHSAARNSLKKSSISAGEPQVMSM
jgi:hypothetical protein